MLERSRYVKENDVFFHDTGEKIGMVYIIEEGGFFGVGWSLCNAEDRFDPVEAKFIARKRALDDYLNNKHRFKDIVRDVTFESLGIKLPGTSMSRFFKNEKSCFSSAWAREMLHNAFDYCLQGCAQDIILTCALEYLRGEEAKLPQGKTE